MARTDYAVSITETSLKNLTARERIILKDTGDAYKLNDVVTSVGDELTIKVQDWAILEVHNEHVDKDQNTDYIKYLFICDDGTKYVTGSETFWNAFYDIYTEMQDELGDEPLEIKCYRRTSKGSKDFLTCSLA